MNITNFFRPQTRTDMTDKEIHDTFRAAGMTEEGTDGLMGNLDWESNGLNPRNVEDRSKIPDDDYTAMVDNDPNYDFVTDNGKQYGYGYAQWTEKSRKAKLLAFARSQGTSIGDSRMQVQFTIKELMTDFPMVWMKLCSSHDLYDCTKIVCDIYENPSVHNVDDRYKRALKFFNKFAGSVALNAEHTAAAVIQGNGYNDALASDACPIFPPDPSVMTIQLVMQYNGYWGKPDGYKSPEFFAALRTFVDDMEKC